ncbi:hypothetical protein PSHT_03005, partial [Puccinia striiformis]
YHNYSAERAREEKVGFAPCECLNCCPNDTAQIINVFQQINTDNFHTILKDPGGVPYTKQRTNSLQAITQLMQHISPTTWAIQFIASFRF